jgi:hypothetical protein
MSTGYDELGRSLRMAQQSPQPHDEIVATYLVALPPPAEREALGLADHLRTLLRYRWLIVAVTALVTALALTAAFLLTPRYELQTVLSYVDNQGQESSLSALAGQFSSLMSVTGVGLGTDSSREEAVALLKAKTFIGSFITDENLLPVLYADRWDAARGAWAVEGDAVPTLWDGIKLFNEKILEVSDDAGTGLITASIEWADAAEAARWLELLVARANASLRARAIEQADKSIEYLNAELGKTSLVNAQQVVYGLIETQINRKMLASVQEEYAFKVLDPPVIPDVDAFAFPNRLLFAAGGVFVGLFLGVAGAFLLDFVRGMRATKPRATAA